MLVRQSAIYLVGRLVPAFIGFGLIALYTRLLENPADYGAYAFVMLNATLAVSLTSTWLGTAAIRYYGRSPEKGPYLWGLAVGLAAVLALVGLAALFYGLAVSGQGAGALVLWGFLIFALTAWFELNADMLTAQFKASRYVLLNVIRTALGGLLGGAFAWLGFGVDGILIGSIIGLALPGAWFAATEWRSFRIKPFHRTMARTMAAYGLPLSVTYGVTALSFATDRLVISALEGATMLGLYAVGFELADKIVRSIASALGTAGLPLLIERLERLGPAAVRAQAEQNLVLLAGVTIPAALGLFAVAPELVAVMIGPGYRAVALEIVPVIALASACCGLRSHYFDHAFHLGLNTRRYIVVVAVMALVNLVGCIVLVRIFGPVGAAYGMVIAYSLGLILSIVLGRRVFALPLLPGTLAKILGASLAMCALTQALSGLEPFPLLVVKVLVGGAFYGALAWLLDIGGLRGRLALPGRSSARRAAR